MRRKCGSECRNGCGNGGLLLWFGLLRMGFRRVWGGFQAVCMLENGCIGGRCGESAVGFLCFSVVKRKRTSHDVPKNKMKKSNTGSTNLFLLFRFRRLRGAKVVFFLFVPAKSWFFLGFQSVFSVFAWWVSGFFRLVSAKMGVVSGVAGFKYGGCGF